MYSNWVKVREKKREQLHPKDSKPSDIIGCLVTNGREDTSEGVQKRVVTNALVRVSGEIIMSSLAC